MPTENTLKLMETYKEKFVSNTLSKEDIVFLNHQNAFPREVFNEKTFSSSEQMQDFLLAIGPLVSKENFHSIVGSFLREAYESLVYDKNSFMRATSLEKVLFAYEFAHYPEKAQEHFLQAPLNDLKENEVRHIKEIILKPNVEIFQQTSTIYYMSQEVINSINELPEEDRYVYVYDLEDNNLYHQGIFDKKPKQVKIVNSEIAKNILSTYEGKRNKESDDVQRFSLPTQTLSSLKDTFESKNEIDNLMQLFKTTHSPKPNVTSTSPSDKSPIPFPSLEDHDNSNKTHLSFNKKLSKKSNIGLAVGVVIGALGALGAGVLITFFTGGFALPILAIIAIAAGAALVGALIGGAIGFFATKPPRKDENTLRFEGDFSF